jgi:hypothetical protein
MHDGSRLRRRPRGATRSQCWALAYVSRSDGTIQSEPCALLDIGKAVLGGIIDRLESSNWVEHRPDPVGLARPAQWPNRPVLLTAQWTSPLLAAAIGLTGKVVPSMVIPP